MLLFFDISSSAWKTPTLIKKFIQKLYKVYTKTIQNTKLVYILYTKIVQNKILYDDECTKSVHRISKYIQKK